MLDAEASAAQFTKFGGRGIVLRFAYFYGPDSVVTREMMQSVKRGISPIVGPPDAYYSSVSHDDAAAAVVEALHLPAGIYNVSDDEPITRGEWVESLAKALDAKPPLMLPHWLTMLGGGTTQLMSRSQRISNRKLRELSDWRPCRRLRARRVAGRARSIVGACRGAVAVRDAVEISGARKCCVAGGRVRLVTEDFAEGADFRGHCNCI